MISQDKSMLESSRSREIVQEILNFGVNDFQIKKIIKFLSLELEDRKLMQEIVKIITEDLEGDSSEDKPRIQI